MKLGRLLLKRIQRKPARSRAKPAQARTERRQTKKLPVLVKPVKAQEAASEPPKTLSLARLIRPDDRLKQSIEAFLLDQRSEHTRKAYGKDLKRFIQFLILRGQQHQRIEEINRATLVAYKDHLLSEGLEHTTVDRHLATLRSFFGWLVHDDLISKNPAESVRFLNPKKVSSTIGFSDEEVRRILALPNLHTRTGSMHYAILMVLFYCGLRRSEVCQLKTSNLTQERGQYVLRLKGKGNAERIVVLTTPVYHALKHHYLIGRKDPKIDQWIFSPIRNNRTGESNKALDPSMLFYIVTKYAKQAGISSRVSPHSCRATAISNARDHHVPDRAIQEFAGWSTPAMITRYDKRRTAVDESASHSISYGAEDRLKSLPAEPK